MREDLRNDQSLNPVEDVEAALVKLQPRRTSVNRERLLFLAGKAAAAAERSAVPRSKRWLWPLATFASVAAMLAFAVLFGIERGRERTAPMVVDHTPRAAVVSPKRSAARSQEANVPAKPQAPVAGVAADVRSSDTLATESRLMRSRHPVLMTDPDLLPNSAPGGGDGTTNRLAVGDTRRAMSDGLSTTRRTTASPSPFPSILNQFRFGRGGL